MKLNPPATSSDLEAAREIARRLHQRRRREDRPDEAGQGAALPPPALRPAPAPVAVPAPRPRPVPPPASPRAPVLEAQEPPEPPSWDEPAADEPTPDALGSLPGFGDHAPEPAESALPPVDFEDAGVSPEEMVGSPEPSPFEELPVGPGYEASSPFDDEPGESASSIEEVYESPAPASWDEIADACLGMAQAAGAMLVDPSGQVFAASGEWPEPGPDAIAAKLVSTMDRTLKDAPTRPISAPLQGRHLTAWRIPVAEGLLTVAFIGEAPVRSEARPAIDSEILRGAGA